jgi:tetratricopeptide (TPR) repeat protein
MSAYLLDLLLSANRDDEAIELARSEFTGMTGKQRVMGLRRLAATYARADRGEEEIEARRDIVESLPEDSDSEALFEAQASLASALARHEQYEQAVNMMNGMIAKAPSDEIRINLLKNLSYIHQQQGRLDLTEARLREAYELAPLNVGLNNDFGYTLADMGTHLDEAERMIRIAVGEQPRQAAYLDSLAWVLYKKGDFKQARKWLLRGTKLQEGQDPVIYDHLGDVHYRLGDVEPAIEAWKKSLALHAERVEQGNAKPDDPQMSRVEEKLAAVQAGRTPEVAPIVETEATAP